MLNFTEFTKVKTPAELVSMQTNAVRSALAYVPVEALRAQLSDVVDMNEKLAITVLDAYTAYGESIKAKVLK